MNRPVLTSIVVDDEEPARYGLVSYINRTPSLRCVGTFEDITSLDLYLEKNISPDIIFLDINMPGMSGIDFIESKTPNSAVIIVTAFEQYALRGFDLNVCDFLLKPVSYERFRKAVDKTSVYLSALRNSTYEDVVFLKGDRKVYRIYKKDIEYLEALENYVRVVTKRERILSRTTLKELLYSLREDGVVQIHRSYAVNIKKILILEKDALISENYHRLPLSRKYKNDLLRVLSEQNEYSAPTQF